MEGIRNKRWVINTHPYKHAIVHDVFDEAVADRLRLRFVERLARRDSKRTAVKNYGATILPFEESDKLSFAPLLDIAWLRLISQALQLDVRFEIDGALHSHPPGSRNGWIHNDYNPGCFGRVAGLDEIYLSSSDGCEYKSGKTSQADIVSVERVRHLTLIYYLNNPPWPEGGGGETGIYSSQSQNVDRSDKFVPPINNTLLLFECSPHSWHSFRATSSVRNSITLWLHRDVEAARKQWPNHEPVEWT